MKLPKTGRAAAAAMSLAAALFAGQTHIWTQGDFSDYEKATLKNLSLVITSGSPRWPSWTPVWTQSGTPAFRAW